MKRLTISVFMILLTTSLVYSQSNIANVSQEKDGNIADIEQVGQLQTAEVVQEGGNFDPGDIVAHYTEINQYGIDNNADVLQTRNQRGNYAWINQYGSLNHAGVCQQDGADFDVLQDGDRNQIRNTNGADRVHQQVGNMLPSATISMEFEQIGDDNRIFARQQGTPGAGGITSKIYQYDNNNEAYSYQLGDGNYVQIIQKGGDNIARIDQSLGFGADAATNNVFSLEQVGGFSKVGEVLEFLQEGSNNLFVGVDNVNGLELNESKKRQCNLMVRF